MGVWSEAAMWFRMVPCWPALSPTGGVSGTPGSPKRLAVGDCWLGHGRLACKGSLCAEDASDFLLGALRCNHRAKAKFLSLLLEVGGWVVSERIVLFWAVSERPVLF